MEQGHIDINFLSSNKKKYEFGSYLPITIEALSGVFCQYEIIPKDSIDILEHSVTYMLIVNEYLIATKLVFWS